MKKLKSVRNERGQGLIEYLLLTALLAIGTMAVVRVLGNSISARYADVINAVQGRSTRQTQVDAVQESQYKKRDMSDFMSGASARGQNRGGGTDASGGDDDGD